MLLLKQPQNSTVFQYCVFRKGERLLKNTPSSFGGGM